MEEGAHLPGTVFTESNRSTHETVLTCHMPPRAAKRASLKRNQTSALGPHGRPAVVPILPLLRGKPLQPSRVESRGRLPSRPLLSSRVARSYGLFPCGVFRVHRVPPWQPTALQGKSRPRSPDGSDAASAFFQTPPSEPILQMGPSDSGQTSVNTQIRARDSPLRSFGDLELCDTTEPPQRALP